MVKIREFKDENGNVLCGADICEYHTSVKQMIESSKGFYTFKNLISTLNHYYEEENAWAVHAPKSDSNYEQVCDIYDMHVAEGHVNDADVQVFINKYPDKLQTPLGDYMLSEIAEVYYALKNGLKDEEIDVMITEADSYKNMRVIRRGYENGLGEKVMIYADVKNTDLQIALLAGLQQDIDMNCISMMRKAHSSVTVHVIWSGIRNGLNLEDADFLLDIEQRIVNEREKYYDVLNDNEIDTYNDMLTLMSVCMEHGRDAAKDLTDIYVEGIKYQVGTDYTINDIIPQKKQGRTK